MGIHSFHRYANDPSLGEEMASFTYKGEDERVFPTLGITVSQGDKFDAPDDFSAENVSATKTTKATQAPTVGDE